MSRIAADGPPPGATASSVRHHVPFFETDAMGIVHHANYVRFLELVRVVWMDEHDRPYREYAMRSVAPRTHSGQTVMVTSSSNTTGRR